MAAPQQSFDPGLTQQVTGEIRRIINKDGTFNVHRRGGSIRSWSPYLFLVDTSWPKFLACILAGYLLLNLLFAQVYLAIGIDHLIAEGKGTGLSPFLTAYFFSVHTLTTVGYGNIYPRGLAANMVAGIEAASGLMAFALGTGLLFARFSRPTALIVFSKSMLVAPYQDITSLQFRIANQRANNLTDLEAKVLLMTVDKTNGEFRRNYKDLPLERTKIFFFPLTWTIVHPIDAGSPLYQKTAEDLKRIEAEFLIVIKGYDDTFSQMVNTRWSYRHEEILWGAKFEPAFRTDAQGDLVLELSCVSKTKQLTS